MRVNTYTNSPCSKEFINEVKNITSQMGKSAKFALKNSGEEYHVAKKTTDVFPEVLNQTPRGWPKGSTYDDLDGLHTGDGIFLFETKKRRNPKYIVAHETGHALDTSFYNITGTDFSCTDGYVKQYNKDIGNLDKNCKKHKIDRNVVNIDYFIQGSKKNALTVGGLRETFAEIYANVKQCGYGIVNKNMDGIMGKIFPNTTKYVTKLVNLLGDKV